MTEEEKKAGGCLIPTREEREEWRKRIEAGDWLTYKEEKRLLDAIDTLEQRVSALEDESEVTELAYAKELESTHAERAALEQRVAAYEEPGRVGARYKALEEMARPAGYTAVSSEPVESFITKRLAAAEADTARLVKMLERCLAYVNRTPMGTRSALNEDIHACLDAARKEGKP